MRSRVGKRWMENVMHASHAAKSLENNERVHEAATSIVDCVWQQQNMTVESYKREKKLSEKIPNRPYFGIFVIPNTEHSAKIPNGSVEYRTPGKPATD